MSRRIRLFKRLNIKGLKVAISTDHPASATVRLLDAWKEKKGIDLDSEAAARLRISQPTISNWRARRSHAAPALAGKMARELEENVALWCAAIEVERAHNADDRKVWEQIVRQLSMATAAMLVLAIGALPWQAIAKPQVSDFAQKEVHIMRNLLSQVWPRCTACTPKPPRSLSAEVISAVHQRFSCRIRADINAASSERPRAPTRPSHGNCPPG